MTNPTSTVPLSCALFFLLKMEYLFGKKKTPEEMLRQNQRALNRAMRDLDKERQKLEQQEKKIIADIKKMAKQGQMVRFGVVVIPRTPVHMEHEGMSAALLQGNNVVVIAGCRQNHGEGLGPHAALRQEVHHDEGQHPGCQPQDPDTQVQQQHGDGNEGGHKSHGHHEPTGQSWLLVNSKFNSK